MATNNKQDTPKKVQEEKIEVLQEKLLREPANSDLIVKCGSRTWKCQSAILMQRCDFFRAACGGSFKEAETRVIDLDGDDEESADMLLLYLYTLQKPIMYGIAGKNSWPAAERAYIVGDKYQVSGLKAAGNDFMLQSTQRSLKYPLMASKTKIDMQGWCQFVERLWTGKIPNAEHLQKALLDNLVPVFSFFMKNEGFLKFLKDNEGFNSEFIAALVKKVCKT